MSRQVSPEDIGWIIYPLESCPPGLLPYAQKAVELRRSAVRVISRCSSLTVQHEERSEELAGPADAGERRRLSKGLVKLERERDRALVAKEEAKQKSIAFEEELCQRFVDAWLALIPEDRHAEARALLEQEEQALRDLGKLLPELSREHEVLMAFFRLQNQVDVASKRGDDAEVNRLRPLLVEARAENDRLQAKSRARSYRAWKIREEFAKRRKLLVQGLPT